MKIFYITNHRYEDISPHALEWIKAANKMGHEIKVFLCTSPGFLEKVDWGEDVKFRSLPKSGTGISGYFRKRKLFSKILKNEIENGTPDFVYERFSVTSIATATVCRNMDVPYVVELNGILDEELKISKASLLRCFYMNRIQKKVFSTATGIIAVTNYIKQYLIESYNCPEEKVAVISNGVDSDYFYPMPKEESRDLFKVPNDKFVIGYLGSMKPWYELFIFIEVAQKLSEKYSDILFLIGGGGEPIFSELKKEIESKGLSDYFQMSGHIPWEQAPAFTSCFDIGVVPVVFHDHKYEVSPMKLFSYMSTGCPVIGNETPGLIEHIEKSDAGSVYKRGSSESLCKKISEIYEMDKQKRIDLGLLGRDYVKNEYSWESLVEKTLKYIDEWITN